jgi:hypothetical protein
MAPYDGFIKPSTIELNTLLIWIQIHDLPVGYKYMIKTLASKVGKYEASEPPSEDLFFSKWGISSASASIDAHISLYYPKYQNIKYQSFTTQRSYNVYT